tara:strand:+ start:165 stop:1418 length:1254 start_codon:yes stop_codon:yes gene_type:complete
MKSNISDKNIIKTNEPLYSEEDLIGAIPYGEEKAKSAVQVMSELGVECFWKYIKSNDLVKKAKKNKTENKLPLKIKEEAELYKKSVSAKKKIQRNMDTLIESLGTIDKVKRGQTYFYYWLSSESKNEARIGEGITNERLLARAIVFSFIDEKFRDFFPPEIMSNLKSDLHEAVTEHDIDGGIAGKMQFIPSGIDVWPSYDITERNPKDWQLAYEALKGEFVIQVDYDSSIESETKLIHLSPQRVQYANHKVVLLCYVHESEKVKAFEVSRLQNVIEAKGHKFKTVNFNDIEKEHEFEAIVNVGVKNYFNSVVFGKEFTSEPSIGGTWIIKAKIRVPEHFSESKKGQPDPFAIANYLSGFADSMEVIKPDFLREEMKRRADNISKLYSDKHDSTPIINKSHHVQTGNLKKLKEIDERV